MDNKKIIAKNIEITEIELKTSIASRLKQIREFYGLKAGEMANILGVKHNTYSEYESGRTKPSLNILIKVAIFFNVSLDYITHIENYTDTYKFTKLSLYNKSNHIPLMDKVHIKDDDIFGVTSKYVNNTSSYRSKKCNLLYKIKNDDMLPKFSVNQIVYINTDIHNKDIRHDIPKNEYDYLIYLNGFNYIVRYYDGNFNSINNPKHCFNYLDNDTLQVIGEVVGSNNKALE